MEVSVKDFRWKMGLNDSQYSQMNDLSKRVLTPAIEGNADIFSGLSVEKIKQGRSVVRLKFTWDAGTNSKRQRQRPKRMPD